MGRGDYKRAAEIFHQIPDRYPQSAYAGQALYYEAYSLYRTGGDDELSTARDRLKQLKQKDAKVWKNDGAVLLTRVCGELAKRGDEDCAADIEKTAQNDPPAQGGKSCPDEDDENDDRIAALNALILMDVAKNDPSQDVREKAVFWLSQVPGSTGLLEEILKGNGDENIKEKALFSLSQQNEPRAQQTLRDFALRESESEDLREKAIFWLGQRRSTENTEFLRNLYTRITNQDLKEKILFSLSQQRGA